MSYHYLTRINQYTNLLPSNDTIKPAMIHVIPLSNTETSFEISADLGGGAGRDLVFFILLKNKSYRTENIIKYII